MLRKRYAIPIVSNMIKIQKGLCPFETLIKKRVKFKSLRVESPYGVKLVISSKVKKTHDFDSSLMT